MAMATAQPSGAQAGLLLLLLGFVSAAEECIRGNGVAYRGKQRFDASGAPCLNWLAVLNSSVSPLLTVSENHSNCRNPDGDLAPWCYINGKANIPERRLCSIPLCAETVTALLDQTAGAEGMDRVFEPVNGLPSRSEAAAVQPVVGISQRVKMRTNEKKDLGILGYVLGLIMMVIIIAIGAGIVVGYVYKRGKDLKKHQEQKVYEREMQRITLPLSAFTNQACELVDENTIVVHTNQTPVEETNTGDMPLMEQAGTPGA